MATSRAFELSQLADLLDVSNSVPTISGLAAVPDKLDCSPVELILAISVVATDTPVVTFPANSNAIYSPPELSTFTSILPELPSLSGTFEV